MKKDLVYKINCENIRREDLIDYALRCLTVGQKSYFYGCLYHYDNINDRLCLDKISLSNKTRVVVVPKFFDTISTNCFSFLDIVELDARYVKYLESNAINFCHSLKSVDLSSCKYFETESINYCNSLVIVKFSNEVDTISESFICSCYHLNSYNFGNVYNLDESAFWDSNCVRNFKLTANYLNKLPYLVGTKFEISVKDCDMIPLCYFMEHSPYDKEIILDRKIRFLGNKHKFESLMLKDITNATVLYE